MWKLIGFDTFSNEEYSLTEHKTQAAAERAASKRLQELEISQPSISSGGQGFGGIQDEVWIERPDGERYRWLHSSRSLAPSRKKRKK